MYVHGELLFPDYVAIALFLLTTIFLLSCAVYGILDVVGFRLPRFSLNRFYCLVDWMVVRWKLDLSLLRCLCVRVELYRGEKT
jgi:hypothetical protein